MNLTQTFKILEIAWRLKLSKKVSSFPIFTLVGDTGIGKSSIMGEFFSQIATSDQANFYQTKYLAQVEVGDLIGMPERDHNKTIWLAPDWWPDITDKGLVFFDELSDAKSDVRAAVMPMLLTGRMHQNVLPEAVLIVCAMNPIGGEFGGYTFTRQFKDRLAFIKVQPTNEEWIAFANKSGLPLYVKNMISEQPDFFLDVKAAADVDSDWVTSSYYDGTPSRRSVTTAAQFYENMTQEERDSVGAELLSAITGDAAAASIITYSRRDVSDLIDPRDLFDSDKELILLGTVQSWATNNSIEKLSSFLRLTKAMLKSDVLTKAQYKPITRLIGELPEDIAMGMLTYIKSEVKSGPMILMSMATDPKVFSRIHKLSNPGAVSLQSATPVNQEAA